MASSAADLIRGIEQSNSSDSKDSPSNLTKESYSRFSDGQKTRFTVGQDNNPARLNQDEPKFLEFKPLATKREDLRPVSPSLKSGNPERKPDFELKEPPKTVDFEPDRSFKMPNSQIAASETSFTKTEFHAFLKDNFNKINSGNDQTLDYTELHDYSKKPLTSKQQAMLKFAQSNYEAVRNLSTSENQDLFSDGYSLRDIDALGKSYMPGNTARRILEGSYRMSISREVADRTYGMAFGFQMGVALTNQSMKFGPKVGLAIAGSLAIVGIGSYLAYNRQRLNVKSLFYSDSVKVKN